LLKYDPNYKDDFTGKNQRDVVEQQITKLHSYWHGYMPDFVLTKRDANRVDIDVYEATMGL
jgi:hypothetical protein